MARDRGVDRDRAADDPNVIRFELFAFRERILRVAMGAIGIVFLTSPIR